MGDGKELLYTDGRDEVYSQDDWMRAGELRCLSYCVGGRAQVAERQEGAENVKVGEGCRSPTLLLLGRWGPDRAKVEPSSNVLLTWEWTQWTQSMRNHLEVLSSSRAC